MRSFDLHYFEERDGFACVSGTTPDGRRTEPRRLDQAESEWANEMARLMGEIDARHGGSK